MTTNTITQEKKLRLPANSQTISHRRGLRWWIGRTLRSLVILLLILVGVALVAGTIAKNRLKAAHPPTGQMVDVGGYRLHIACQGTGSPTVILDAGQGDFSLTWVRVQPTIGQSTRVCVYDRAGLGWSEPSPKPRTAAVIVEELRTLLQNANIPGPYVLVGQSLGGLHIRHYAHTYPDEVAGLVFVDAAHEQQYAPVQAKMDKMMAMMPIVYGVQKFLVSTGVPALFPNALPVYIPSTLPAATAGVYRSLYVSDPKLVATAAREFADLPQSHADLRTSASANLGDLPIRVLTHGHCDGCGALTPEELAQFEQNWRRLQEELAALSSNSKLIHATESGHAIHLDQPDLVITAIQELVAASGQ